MSFANLNMKSSVPLCILTNGEDKDKIILLSTIKNDGWCTRSWINLRDSIAEGKQVTNVKYMISKHHNLAHINPMHVSFFTFHFVIVSTFSGEIVHNAIPFFFRLPPKYVVNILSNLVVIIMQQCCKNLRVI